MGWEKEGSMPGICETASSISRTRSSLVSPERHCDSGLKSTKISEELKIFGSVPSSGRPTFEMTVCTSGTLCSALRTSRIRSCASPGETDGGSMRFTQVVPSFSSGRNSLPSWEASARATASAPTAMASTRLGCATALRSHGS